jgi:putative inorganic carbon (HCO3(-)) transporter
LNKQFEIPLNELATGKKTNLFVFLQRVVVQEKFNSPIGFLILAALAAVVSFSIYYIGLLPGVLALVLLAAIPFLYSIVAYPRFGIATLMVAAYLLMWVIKMGLGFPVGTIMDGLQVFLLLGLFLKIKYNPPKGIYKNPVTYCIVIWVAYNLAQVANPAAESKLSWLYTIRSVAMVMLMYFVFMYHIQTKSFLKLIVKLWLALSVFAALYALWQEYVGFLPFEQSGLDNPDVRSLLFIDGRWRKFSIFADPVTFSYNMVASSMLCIGLITGNIARNKKWILIGMTLLFSYVMLFSGTRGAYVLPPVGLALLAIIKMSKQMFAAALVAGAVFLFLIFVPTSNYTLHRFQTAFKPSDDPSFNVRKYNQKRIQPYILSHPLGGGLGSTGAWGQRFAPNSYLANFPPDSGYVRVAVELGWVGILLFCTLIFVALKTGINNYYRIKDPWLKSVCLAMLLIVFALSVGNYPQEAFVQFPTSIFLYLAIAILNLTMRLDKPSQNLMQYESTIYSR